MFDRDNWLEIFETLSKNKLRTFLTSFSVFWGIFILMILLGSGNGLHKGVMYNFSDAINSVWLWGGRTSEAYAGFNEGRRITFKNDDVEYLDKIFPQIENLSGRIRIYGGNHQTSYKNNYADFDIQAIYPGYQEIERIKLLDGRLLNNYDIEQYRKVAIMGSVAKEKLFKDESPVGKYVNISNIPFLIVGVFGDIHEGETERLYVPLSVVQKTFAPGSNVGSISFTTGTTDLKENDKLLEEIKKALARKHSFNIDDQSAMGISDDLDDFRQMTALFNGIKIFVGIIGVLTLIAGIVGVSNIMLIVVKERTKEIGIRKAIGATPRSIIGLIVLEALVITSVSGYLGLLSGVFLLEFIGKMMPASEFFRNPGVDFNIAISAALLVVVAGVIAGFIPARKASKIKPIVALRDE